MGNRDINKMRFATELAEMSPTVADVFWDAGHTPYDDFVAKLPAELQAGNPRLLRLRWMLHCTMGCQTTFRTRRMELSLLRHGTMEGDVSDAEVLHSFVASVDPRGSDPWMLRYLQLGQLMAVVGDTLFVHGGVSALALGQVPASSRALARGGENAADLRGGGSEVSLMQWCGDLNRWAAGEIADYAANPLGGPFGGGVRAAEALLQYAVPAPPGHAMHGVTVIYNEGVLRGGRYVEPEPEVVACLARAGVRRMLVGHVPRGQSPGVIRAPGGLVVVLADTSYSDCSADKTANPANMRGAAVASVRAYGSGSTVIDGVRADGVRHGVELAPAGGDRPVRPDDAVGIVTPGLGRIKGVLRSGHQSGFFIVVPEGDERCHGEQAHDLVVTRNGAGEVAVTPRSLAQ